MVAFFNSTEQLPTLDHTNIQQPQKTKQGEGDKKKNASNKKKKRG